MAQAQADADSRVPLSWIVVFLVLVFGLGIAAVLFVGGHLIAPSGFLLV
ncbi:MAG: hypothetical protein ABEJ23_08870 [Haloarculaceae archaeon]